MLPGVLTNEDSSIETQKNSMNWMPLGAFSLFSLTTVSDQGGVDDTNALT
jgi:hypothetical protein